MDLNNFLQLPSSRQRFLWFMKFLTYSLSTFTRVVWYSKVWYGMVIGMARYGMARCSKVYMVQQGMMVIVGNWQGHMVWYGKTSKWQSVVWQGMVWQRMPWHLF